MTRRLPMTVNLARRLAAGLEYDELMDLLAFIAKDHELVGIKIEREVEVPVSCEGAMNIELTEEHLTPGVDGYSYSGFGFSVFREWPSGLLTEEAWEQ